MEVYKKWRQLNWSMLVTHGLEEKDTETLKEAPIYNNV